MQVVLVMFRSDGERRSFSVVRNMTVVGRREDCDLRIPVGDVSRKHCRLVRTDDGIRIEDLGSSNGTYVNGHRIQESDLNAGDTVGVGPVQFIVQIDGVPSDGEIAAPSSQAAETHHDESSLQGHPSPAHADELVAQDAVVDQADEPEFVLEEEPAPAEEFAIDEVEEHAIVEEPIAELEPVTEPELVAEPELEAELEPAAEPEPLAELEPVDELEPLDEFEPVADLEEVEEFAVSKSPPPPPPLPPPTPQPIATDAETIDTDPVAEPHTSGQAPEDSEFDFLIEEADPHRSKVDFNIDLDSHHGQPHGQG